MKKLAAYFFTEYNLSIQTLRFKQLLYLFIVLKVIYWLAYYDLYFGEHAIAYARPYSLGAIKDLAFLLYNHAEPNFGYAFIFGTLLFLSLSYFLKKIPFIFEFTVWLLVINIHNKIYPTLTGGDLLLNQFLFFNCFLSKTFNTNLSLPNEVLKCLHNFAVVAILIQIQLVYLIAGIAKLNSSDWLAGTAINELSRIEHFNLFSGPLFKNTIINCCINFIVLFYQLLFPVLIRIQKIKKPLLILGIAMHLYISFVTGLVSFGLIMIIAYVYFWPIKKQAI
ncbi:MAG: HTTM domain-containing protein [Bacteroidetes bacterium]|nr:HTTM domain-containing protein [Bacteroidota bacterium]